MANERVFNNLRSYLQIYFHDFTENTAQDVVNSLEEVQLAVLLCNPQLQVFLYVLFYGTIVKCNNKNTCNAQTFRFNQNLCDNLKYYGKAAVY